MINDSKIKAKLLHKQLNLVECNVKTLCIHKYPNDAKQHWSICGLTNIQLMLSSMIPDSLMEIFEYKHN